MKSILIILPLFGAVFTVLWVTPPVVFGIGAIIVALLALNEYFSFFDCAILGPRFCGFFSLIISFLLLSQVLVFPKLPASASVSLAVIILFSAIVFRSRIPGYEEFFKLSAVAFSLIYIVLPFSFLILIRYMPQGRELITVVILIVWARELGAGLGGLLFPKARHPINKNLNPNKTYIGALVGLCTAILVAIISINLLVLDLSLSQMIVWGLAIGVVCQLGDLSESYLKRMAKRRHSSTLLGPRGGLLDILDAFTFAIIITNFLLFVWSQ